MYYRIIATLALSFVFFIGNSQISYHRLYETTLNDQTGMNDTTFYHMSSATITGDVYAMGTKRVIIDPTNHEDLSIVFTKHSDKGNIDWSMELDLGQDTVDILGIGRMSFNSTEDSLLFVIGVEINGQHEELYGKMNLNATSLELHKVGGSQLGMDNNLLPNVTPFINQTDILLTPGTQPTISRLGVGNDLLWSRSYEFTDGNGDARLHNITDIKMTPDSTIILTGIPDGIDDDFVVIELDSNGVQIWAESYLISVNDLGNTIPNEVEPLDDGTFAVAGSYFTGTPFTSNGFVAIIDSSGSLLMSKQVSPLENNSRISNLLKADDGTLWMSGTYVDDSMRYFTTNMSLDGTINWTTIYPGEQAGFGPFTTSLLSVQSTGGATFIGHGFIDDLPVLQVMKHNIDGTTPCSDTLTIIPLDLMLVSDTLTSEVVNGGLFFDSLSYELNSFIGFSPPTLSINQYDPFCPNEMIDTFLIATVDRVADENVTYLWSTGEMTDTIRVMMDGQYSVTVTITEDVCYSMCDTVELTRYELPQINISQDNSRFCEEMIIVLNSNYTPGAPGETFLWNTMEVTPSIEVTEAGVYSVTVTDECGEMAFDDMDVALPVFDPNVFFGANVLEYCATDTIVLTAGYSGGGNMPEFIWSDGQMGNPIIVTSLGTYSVTVTDECGLFAEASEEAMIDCEFLRYPIAFFPNGDDIDSKTFGPIPDTLSLDRITEVDFKIFNRWGETVFESNAILDAWDGTHKGEPAPSEVYIWYVSYMIDGDQMIDKGDVTLIR